MTTILQRLNALVPCSTFIFQVLCIISEKKMGRATPHLCHCSHVVQEPYSQLKTEDIAIAATTG